LIRKLYQNESGNYVPDQPATPRVTINPTPTQNIFDTEEFVEESLSLEDKEIEMIRKALEKHKGKRKYAALELGISERTLYRKIKEFNIE
jgi:transcriptional regulator with PAS, ATPase and Fis domain